MVVSSVMRIRMIKKGDFIKSKDFPWICGVVVAKVNITRRRWEFWKIEKAEGKVDFIRIQDAELICGGE